MTTKTKKQPKLVLGTPQDIPFKLAAASPALLELYETDALSLDQLMAFCVTDDHARQDQVWSQLQNGYSQEPRLIRRMLTEGAVRADDRRAVFVGVEAYEAAGGIVVRDLFEKDRGGYLQDAALLDRLASEKLEREADAIRAEGWRWVEAAIEHPYERASGMHRVHGEVPELTAGQQAEEEALRAEAEALEQEYADADEYPDEVDQRLGEIETALARLDDRPAVFDPADLARAGALISIGSDGGLRVERGYLRPEDAAEGDTTGDDLGSGEDLGSAPDVSELPGRDDGPKPLPDRLLVDLTAWRTMALRDALAQDPDTAQLALLHALCLALFYHGGSGSCLEIKATSSGFRGVMGLERVS